MEDRTEEQFFKDDPLAYAAMKMAEERMPKPATPAGLIAEIWEQVEIMQSGPRKARFIQILSGYAPAKEADKESK